MQKEPKKEARNLMAHSPHVWGIYRILNLFAHIYFVVTTQNRTEQKEPRSFSTFSTYTAQHPMGRQRRESISVSRRQTVNELVTKSIVGVHRTASHHWMQLNCKRLFLRLRENVPNLVIQHFLPASTSSGSHLPPFWLLVYLSWTPTMDGIIAWVGLQDQTTERTAKKCA